MEEVVWEDYQAVVRLQATQYLEWQTRAVVAGSMDEHPDANQTRGIPGEGKTGKKGEKEEGRGKKEEGKKRDNEDER